MMDNTLEINWPAAYARIPSLHRRIFEARQDNGCKAVKAGTRPSPYYYDATLVSYYTIPMLRNMYPEQFEKAITDILNGRVPFASTKGLMSL